MKNKNILITRSSGFIECQVTKFFLNRDLKIIGINNHNDYYNKK